MSNIKEQIKGFYPTWSHLTQDIPGSSDAFLPGRYTFVIYLTDKSGKEHILTLDADTMVIEVPKFFQPGDTVIPAKIMAISDKWGTGFVASYWITRKGGIFKRRALPENELMREVFLNRYLKELEK